MSILSQDLTQQFAASQAAETSLASFPDFLVIGPHRSGTTWLQANLKQHPQIFFPAQKELHFFCEHQNLRPEPCRESNSLENYLKIFRQSKMSYVKSSLATWRKYGELYRPKIRGEATACYAMLDSDSIQTITTLNPQIKIILMVRNPIDRTWSHARHFFDRAGRHISEVSEPELDKFFQTKYAIPAGKYSEILARWLQFVPKNSLFIGRFDDVKSSPEALILQAFDFLGVRRSTQYVGALARKKVNSVEPARIPDKYRQLLEAAYREEFEKLNDQFNFS